MIKGAKLTGSGRYKTEMYRHAGLAIFLLSALVVTGSWHFPSSTFQNSPNSSTLSGAAIQRNATVFRETFAKGQFRAAHDIFLRMAREAEQRGSAAEAMSGWNNAGACSLALRQYRAALEELLRSRRIADQSGGWEKAARASTNIAALYIQMGNFEAAVRVASDATTRKSELSPLSVARLDAERAEALSNLGRLDEARPVFNSAIDTLDNVEPSAVEKSDPEWETRRWDADVRARGIFGIQLIKAGDTQSADRVLTEALRLARVHQINAANALRALALLKAAQHDQAAAAHLFAAALTEPDSSTPRWLIYADRGEFRLHQDDARGALSDFHEARRLASQMRADVVPADEDRVTLESGLGRIAAGIVNADNLQARAEHNRTFLRDSFDVAEQDRQWSLRALVPVPDDWRTRLPAEYWDLLAQYQNVVRAAGSATAGPAAERAEALALRLQTIEAAAGRDVRNGAQSSGSRLSTLEAAQKALPPGAVLFSFYTGAERSWLWAITRDRFDLYPVPASRSLEESINGFVSHLRSRNPDAAGRGRELYSALFGGVAVSYLKHPTWLLELDGPLYNLPFPALVTSPAGEPPHWLIENASIRIIPGALMMESGAPGRAESFVGIADPVYNGADPRFTGPRSRVESSLARLPNTESEVKSCALAWGPGRSRILTGMDAGSASFESALRGQPSILHFATHVVSGESDHGSGIIALSLDPQGRLGLLGPREILARAVKADLVVLDGCHSAQAAALPGAGLMGLTRAWIGAGAHAVLATLWDIPDDAQSPLPAFYSALRAHPDRSAADALRAAQLAQLGSNKNADPATWAGYFLLARR